MMVMSNACVISISHHHKIFFLSLIWEQSIPGGSGMSGMKHTHLAREREKVSEIVKSYAGKCEIKKKLLLREQEQEEIPSLHTHKMPNASTELLFPLK
jgi:hypothetical protein